MPKYKIIADDAILPLGAAKDTKSGKIYQQGQMIPKGIEIEAMPRYVKALVERKEAEEIKKEIQDSKPKEKS